MSPARSTEGAPISSIGRGIAVLACFTPRAHSLTLSELSQKSKLPMSSTHRVVAELTTGGFLVRGKDKRYRIGTRMWSIAQLAPVSDQLRDRSLPTLARLYEETGENITLAVLDRGQALYVDRLVGEKTIPSASRAGGHLPLHTTGVGKVLLAYLDKEKIDSYLSRPLQRPTPFSITDPEKLLTELTEVRQRGYAVARQEMTPGSGSVAVPILRRGRCIAAVGVVSHLNKLDVPHLVDILNQAALSIARELEEDS
ncbi:MAG: IclR family transcriptional regulator [Actinobacteria bacterium]|nr:IclR family transcriptional regulator [Actinomycetota bacterium]